ncbi:hypothetical protein LX16_5200 [Stackebrandtia albiflava]|uniref:Uncharacterized protein n=1 Tax=Stackebrandtia albiflava TaxID=406432 RepID=A0A562ULH5_9ACTN|nr:hypothetical protein [Stackebrandtia albiflava]TWJ06464.1 hypothetical protein LX16_5200 [Stackebrandtia albiflava]
MLKTLTRLADSALDRLVIGRRAGAGCPTEYYWETTCYGHDGCVWAKGTAQWRWVITSSCTAKRTSTYRCC